MVRAVFSTRRVMLSTAALWIEFGNRESASEGRVEFQRERSDAVPFVGIEPSGLGGAP